MEQIIITHRNGTTLKLNSKENVSAITKATQTVDLLGADVVDISVESATKLNFYIGDKITVIGRDYTLNTPAKERKISERNFVYDMQFEGVQYDLLRASFNVNIDTTTNAIQDISGDSITGDIKLFLDVLVANANRVFGSGKWTIGTYPLNSKTITMTFNDSDSCLTVLQNLCGESNFGTEFKILIDGSGNRTLNVGTIGNNFTHTFEYGKGKGIYELTREKLSSSNIVTRLNTFGGSKNIITPKYRASKLCLATKSKSQSFIEDAIAISNYGVWEATKDFPEIYPHRKSVVSSLGANVFEFIDTSMDFDLNEKNVDGTTKYLMAGTSAKINFSSGNLAGYEFEVSAYDLATKKFTIISQTDQNDYVFPSTTSVAFQIAVGDEYIISDIYMPQSYIDNAEAELLIEANKYLARYSQPLVQYGLTIDPNFLKNQVGANVESNIVWVGDYIPIKDTDLEVDKTIRVKGFTRDLMQDYAYQITIADLSVTVSTINRVISGMNEIDKVVKINNLNDPAKARRNWKDSQEVLNMIFDPEGDYYTEKIKPLSIETSMLSVGAKSMQFGLEGTIFQPNYLGNKNRIFYVGGTLSHYAIVDSNDVPRTWNITGGDMLMLSDTARYVYAKCLKVGTGATILFSEDKITVESDPTYYHFLIGVLNSVDANNTRALALTYGFTTVNGKFIRTGKIQSQDGVTYFDLDAGEFRGNFKFSSGASVETSVSTAQTTANNATTSASNAQSTANSKSKHFTGITPPIPPYTQGLDTWTNGTELYECAITRASGTYVGGDFVKATGYDNTKTIIDGGLVTSGTVQVAGDSNIKSGITGQGVADSSVRMWAGNTFANRSIAPFRVQQNGKVFMTDADIQGVVKALSGSIGNFTIKDGNIIGSDGGVERIKLKTGSIETIANMDSAAFQELPLNFLLSNQIIGHMSSNNETNYLEYTISNAIVISENTILKFYGNGVNINYIPSYGIATTSIEERFNLVGVNSNITPNSTGFSLNVNSGTYTLIYKISVYAYLDGGDAYDIFATNSGVKVEIQQGVGKTEIGKNGFYSYFGSNNFVHYSQENGLVFKGNLNVPGFLASGSINISGGKSLLCGSKNNTTAAAYTATGIYDVSHIAGANYQVMLNALGDNITAYLVSKSTNSFRVQIRNSSNTAVAGSFEYTIFGIN